MGLRRTDRLATILVVLALASGTAAGGPIDPLLQFKVIRTAHFRIYFHQGEDELARSLATVAERVHGELSPRLLAGDDRRTDVVLLDQFEEANGWATPLPRNIVMLHAAAPAGSELIGNTSDWLDTLFRHEYAHILHLDRSQGWARVARAVLGRSPIAFPNLWLPQWQIEGVATLFESSDLKQGRPGAGDFRAVARQDALAGHRLTLDRASGGLIGWPGGQAAYSAGFEFHNYLSGRFGEDSLARLADATARRVPFLGGPAFKKVFGESAGRLWRESERSRTPASTVPPDPTIRRITYQGNVALGPRFLEPACEGCPRMLVYASRTPHDFPSLRIVSTTGANDRALTTRYLGSTTATTSGLLVFDQQEFSRSTALVSDLYALDRRTGSVERLTYASRLQDPDVTSDASKLVAVRENRGRRDLVIADLSRGTNAGSRLSVTNLRVLASEPETQFSAPRWSPDGTRVAVERRRLGRYPHVVVFDAHSGTAIAAWGDPPGHVASPMRVVTPTWRPDGRAIVAAVSSGPAHAFDLVEFRLDGDPSQGLPQTFTLFSAGEESAFWPDVSPDGREIAFVAYTASGYDIYIKPLVTDPSGPVQAPRRMSPAEEATSPGRAYEGASAVPPKPRSAPEPYSPLETLMPTSWAPLLESDSVQTRIGALISGTDVLSRHAYAVQGSWLTQRSYMTSPLPSGPDWSVSYAYTRWRPTYFGSLSRETQFRRLAATASATASTHAVVRHEAQAGILWPLVRVRHNSRALFSLVDARASDLLEGRTVDSHLVSARAAVGVDTSRRYGYSISREHGLNAGGTLEVTRRALGGVADADTMTLDGRGYLPGLRRHHVIAVRGAFARSTGDNGARQSFALGGMAASPSVIDFGSDAVGLFRGHATDFGHVSQFLATNIEYRLPLRVIERGYGTLPLLLRMLHASVFVDVLQPKEVGATAARHLAAAGAELSLDAVVGYSLPGSVSVGAAWTMPRRGAQRDARLYLRLGRAF